MLRLNGKVISNPNEKGVSEVRVPDPFGDNFVIYISLLTPEGWRLEAEEHHGSLVDSAKTLSLRMDGEELVISSSVGCQIKIKRRKQLAQELRLLPSS